MNRILLKILILSLLAVFLSQETRISTSEAAILGKIFHSNSYLYHFFWSTKDFLSLESPQVSQFILICQETRFSPDIFLKFLVLLDILIIFCKKELKKELLTLLCFCLYPAYQNPVYLCGFLFFIATLEKSLEIKKIFTPKTSLSKILTELFFFPSPEILLSLLHFPLFFAIPEFLFLILLEKFILWRSKIYFIWPFFGLTFTLYLSLNVNYFFLFVQIVITLLLIHELQNIIFCEKENSSISPQKLRYILVFICLPLLLHSSHIDLSNDDFSEIFLWNLSLVIVFVFVCQNILLIASCEMEDSKRKSVILTNFSILLVLCLGKMNPLLFPLLPLHGFYHFPKNQPSKKIILLILGLGLFFFHFHPGNITHPHEFRSKKEILCDFYITLYLQSPQKTTLFQDNSPETLEQIWKHEDIKERYLLLSQFCQKNPDKTALMDLLITETELYCKNLANEKNPSFFEDFNSMGSQKYLYQKLREITCFDQNDS